MIQMDYITELEKIRSQYWVEYFMWNTNRVGGNKFQVTEKYLGKKNAKKIADEYEERFQRYLDAAKLDMDGNTTDPTLPDTLMHVSESWRLSINIAIVIEQFFQDILDVMPENLNDWSYDGLYYNLYPFVTWYQNRLVELLRPPLPRGMKAMVGYDVLEQHIQETAKYYSDTNIRTGMSRMQVRDAIAESFVKLIVPTSNTVTRYHSDSPEIEFGVQISEKAVDLEEVVNPDEEKKVLH